MTNLEFVEVLSSKLHNIYQKEARRQGDVRHTDVYADLKENTKEFDRVLARFIIKHVRSNVLRDHTAQQILNNMINDSLGE